MIKDDTSHRSIIGLRQLRRIALVIAICACIFAGRWLHLGPLQQFLLIGAVTLVAIPVVMANERVSAAQGSLTSASRQYNRRMLVFLYAYFASQFAAHGLNNQFHPTGPLLWLVAILPALAIVYYVWAIGRYLVEEKDEYLRSRRIFAGLVGTGVLLVVSTLWGFLEGTGAVPHVEAWWNLPLWIVGVGIGNLVNHWRGA